MTTVLNRCGGCLFFVVNVDPKFAGVEGHCRVNPPQLVVHPDNRGNAVIRSTFPMVGRAQWCGQFESTDEETTQ
jgi:hypothetical protein